MASRYRTYRRLRFGSPIIVVSGLPRSGTSMAMKMLASGGVALVEDGIRAADVDNPAGYYEHERVKDLGRQGDKRWLASARGKAIKVISYLLRELPPIHNYKVLFMRRDLREILASQSKMLARRGEQSQTDDARMAELFERDLWRASYLLRTRPEFESLELHYSAVLIDPLTQAARIRAFLADALPGVPLDPETMASAVDPDLYRNRLADD